ncbi:ankyrin repeat-containing domain protein [Aspergillus keveii]|uniref:Ankyrin repeat-containing domain protein n=1 Tax=Aspergillus keveii TaxID=714993 RepID=A0ABR4FP27_9EURO
MATFLSLSTEIIILVGGYLTRSSLNSLAQSCKSLGDNLESASPQYPPYGTPLCVAAYLGHEAVVKLFLETGKCDPNAWTADDGSTPLHLAAMNCHEAVMRLLLQTASLDLNATDRIMNTPLHDAALNGYAAAMKLLLHTAEVDKGGPIVSPRK